MRQNVVYDRHEQEWERALSDENRKLVASTWLNQKNTLDRWRHERMYKFAEPLIRNKPSFKWLTIGDGRYGTDAHALLNMGVKDVMCTDISDKLLRIGAEAGFIREFSAQNAENLSFGDGEFDFILCKEAFHHFPRPHLALHEMLRVAEVGVMLIEPLDPKINPKVADRLLPLIRLLFGRKGNFCQHTFEPVGNYMYSVSERELEKVQLGMHRRFVAFNYLNDYYEQGYEFILLDTKSAVEKARIIKASLLIFARDILTRLGLISPGLLIAILFKSEPDGKLLNDLRREKWKVRVLPENPYLHESSCH